jgi:carbamoyltransferase
MIILGINAHHADSSAAIFIDGILIAATEEERFRRIKHWAGFPSLAIEFCLKEAGLTSINEVDHIAIGRDPKAKFLKKLLFFASRPIESFVHATERLLNQKKVSSIENAFANHFDINPEDLKNKIHQVEHHRSHLASAFFASPFDEAAIVSIDGSGDFTTTMLAIGKGNSIKVIDSIDFPHSLGIFYTAFTQLLGFPHYGDEYKVMGLAPYGEPKYVDQLHQVIQLNENGLFKLNLEYFRSPGKGFVLYNDDNIPAIPVAYADKLERLFCSARKKDEPLSQYHKDLAASVQKMSEIVIFHILNHLHKLTGLENLCLAGGVAQNSVANGKIINNTPFKNIYIPSAGHDAGISMGAAQYVYHQILSQSRVPAIYSACTGSHFTNDYIISLLNEKNIPFKQLEDEALFEYVADKIVNAGVVGWFNGRAEFGPRALGARSILANPGRADAKDLINSKIKRRESFRPFAPSILKEYVGDYFESTDLAPFMERVYPIKEDKRASIPAVTHADGSGRLQTVDKIISPRYYQLIDAFRRRSGIPILLNTSFNENEPIVNKPEEALDCFLRTDMDMLVMENIIVER